MRKNDMKTIKRIYHWIMYVLFGAWYFILFPISFLIYGKKKIWIISEVDFDARDNGYHFFVYLSKHHPDINTVFVISYKNKYFDKVKALGQTIEPNSLKHWLVFISSRVKLSTYVNGSAPSYYTQLLLKHIHPYGLNVALKHGIFKNSHPNYFCKNAHLDLICCGSPREVNFINSYFGYKKDVAKNTGLARFDNLYNKPVCDVILVMPTWRRWLDECDSVDKFEQSIFYKKWKELLENKVFNDCLNIYNISVVFYVHPKLNNYLNSFDFLKANQRFKILNSIDGDEMQEQIIASRLLITDYSSVFFDFSYSRKPVVFYQFDEKEYYAQHYQKGYFDYYQDGFGPVESTAKKVIEEINKIAEKEFTLSDKYKNRINDFFSFYDSNCCERIFNEINNLKKRR